MKIKHLVLCLLFLGYHTVKGQEASVEKNIFNIQAGLLGAWVNNEFKISDQVALRTEAGLNLGYYISYNYGSKYVLAPTITLEPRWYYNLENRLNKGKRIANNSGNFVGIRLNYMPDWFVISNYEDISIANQISIIPKWGARRSIGNTNFNYEFGGGIGYKHVFLENQPDDSRLAVDVHLRIGYTF